jgi:hypothetical protein
MAAVALAAILGVAAAKVHQAPMSGVDGAAYPDRVNYAGQLLTWERITALQNEGQGRHILIVGNDRDGLRAFAYDSLQENRERARLTGKQASLP